MMEYCSSSEPSGRESSGQMGSGDTIRVTKEALRISIAKIRLKGGEPLIRNDIVDIVRMINNVKNVEEVLMTTRGILLGRIAKQLKRAGLNKNLNVLILRGPHLAKNAIG